MLQYNKVKKLLLKNFSFSLLAVYHQCLLSDGLFFKFIVHSIKKIVSNEIHHIYNTCSEFTQTHVPMVQL